MKKNILALLMLTAFAGNVFASSTTDTLTGDEPNSNAPKQYVHKVEVSQESLINGLQSMSISRTVILPTQEGLDTFQEKMLSATFFPTKLFYSASAYLPDTNISFNVTFFCMHSSQEKTITTNLKKTLHNNGSWQDITKQDLFIKINEALAKKHADAQIAGDILGFSIQGFDVKNNNLSASYSFENDQIGFYPNTFFLKSSNNSLQITASHSM